MIDASTSLDSQARRELGNVLDFQGMLDLQDYRLNRRYLPQTLQQIKIDERRCGHKFVRFWVKRGGTAGRSVWNKEKAEVQTQSQLEFVRFVGQECRRELVSRLEGKETKQSTSDKLNQLFDKTKVSLESEHSALSNNLDYVLQTQNKLSTP